MSVKYNQSRSANKGVKVGDRAPDFTLPSLTGKSVSLESFFGKKNIVLYFYPKDNTAGCTAEACSFRDSYEVFQEAGAEVIGISSDSEKTHQQFADKHRLPFILLSDLGGVVEKVLWCTIDSRFNTRACDLHHRQKGNCAPHFLLAICSTDACY